MAKRGFSTRTPALDMNPMVDMAFLLVSFFMLTTTFKTAEPVTVERPTSQTEIKLPETDLVTITVAKDGRVFYMVDGKFVRQRLLERIGERYDQHFTTGQKENFALLSSFGLPVADLGAFLELPPAERKEVPQRGIPCDSLRNELRDWIVYTRVANPRVRFSVNADQGTHYELVWRVIQTLTDNNIYRFNLVTELEAAN